MAGLGKTPAVSGETMTEASLVGTLAGADIADADYVEIAHEARRAPLSKMAAVAPPAGLTMLNPTEAGAMPMPVKRGGAPFWTFGLIAVAAAFWVSGGHAYVRESGIFAATKDIGSQLRIGDVRSRTDKVDGIVALLVDGEVVNDGQGSGARPPLWINVIGNSGDATTYRLRTDGIPLAPGASFSFSSRLDMPKEGLKAVLVTFDE